MTDIEADLLMANALTKHLEAEIKCLANEIEYLRKENSVLREIMINLQYSNHRRNNEHNKKD